MTNASIQPGTHCTRCGYDLAGLQETGTCPECGELCTHSTHQHLYLKNKGNPISQIQSGLAGTLLGYALLISAVALYILGLVAKGISRDTDIVFTLFATVVFLAGCLVLLPAQLAVATPITTEANPHTKRQAPTVMSVGLLGLLVSIFAAIGTALVPGELLNHLAGVVLAVSVFMTLLGLCSQAGSIAASLGVPALAMMNVWCTRLLVTPISLSLFLSHTLYTHARFKNPPVSLGLNAGNWEDILIITIIACCILQFGLSFVFWKHLRNRLASSDLPPTSPPTAP